MAFVTVLRVPSLDDDDLDEDRVEDLTVRQETLVPTLTQLLESRIEMARKTLGEEAADNERSTQVIVLLGRVMDLTRDLDDDYVTDIWQAAFFVGKCHFGLDERPKLLPEDEGAIAAIEDAISDVLSEGRKIPPLSVLN